MLAAFVIAEPGKTLHPEDIRAELADVLARYAVPEHVIVVDELPFTLNRKADEGALLARLDAPADEDPVTAVLELCLRPMPGDAGGNPPNRSPLTAMSSLTLIDFHRRLQHEHGVDLPLQRIYGAAT